MPSDGENPSRGLGGGAENAAIRECTHDLYFSAVLLTACAITAPRNGAAAMRGVTTSRGMIGASGLPDLRGERQVPGTSRRATVTPAASAERHGLTVSWALSARLMSTSPGWSRVSGKSGA